jgi:hypothetical protein
MKLDVNKLRFLLITHTTHFDARFHSYGVLNLGQGAEQILDRLYLQPNDQVLRV